MYKIRKSEIKLVIVNINEKNNKNHRNITLHCIAQNFQMKYIMSMVSTRNERVLVNRI